MYKALTIRKVRKMNKLGIMAACKVLKMKDYEILETSWQCKHGEVDIIAKDNDELVFIEVNTRRDGLADEAISASKRKRYEQIACDYLVNMNDVDFMVVRFDIISIQIIENNRAFLRHHINVFATAQVKQVIRKD